MKRLVILCDFDDVLINFCEVWVDLINQQNGTSVSVNDITDWNISKAFPTLTREQIYKPLNEVEIWNYVTPLPGAVEYLEKLIDDGHVVYIVTSSHYKTIATKIEKVLMRYFPYFSPSNVIVANYKQMIHGDILIDDGEHNLIGGDYVGIMFNQPHNLNSNLDIERVDNWEELYSKICNLSKVEYEEKST